MANIDALIYTQKTDIRGVLRDELRKIGIEADKIVTARDPGEIVSLINQKKEAILILDWDAGADVILDILDQNRAKGKIDSHPTFLLTSKMDENIVATATEYHVSKIHTGEISASQIKQSLREVYDSAKNASPIKRLMIQVAKFRTARQFDKVNEILEPIYEKAPGNPRIAVEFGENLLEQGELDRAEEVLTAAAELTPPYARAKHLLAKVYLKKGNPTKSVACLRGAQLISPYNVNRLLEMGNLFMDIDRPQDAKASFDEVLSIAPGSKDGSVGKGSAMLALGEVNEALSLIKEATSTRELASIFNTSAVLSIRKGNHEEAMNLYKTALGAVGKNKKVEARLWYNMGIGFVKWKKIQDSLDCFKKSNGLDASFEDAKHNLELIERALGGKPSKPTSKKKPAAGSPTPARPKAQPAQKIQTAETLEEDFHSEIGSIEETLGGENLTQEFGSLNFDLDFGDDLDDED